MFRFCKLKTNQFKNSSFNEYLLIHRVAQILIYNFINRKARLLCIFNFIRNRNYILRYILINKIILFLIYMYLFYMYLKVYMPYVIF